MSMDFCSSTAETTTRTAHPAEPRLGPSPMVYPGTRARSARPTGAMKAWVRHVFRTLNGRRYGPSPVILSDPALSMTS